MPDSKLRHNTRNELDDKHPDKHGLYDAWARGDGDGYAACFAEKSDYITFNGMHLHGRAENAELHGAIELLSSGVALVHTVGAGARSPITPMSW